jgi:RNase P subunit RPR2
MRTRCVYCDEVLDPHKRVLVREREDGTTLWCCSTGECLARYHREQRDSAT